MEFKSGLEKSWDLMLALKNYILPRKNNWKSMTHLSPGIRRSHLRLPDLQMSCKDMNMSLKRKCYHFDKISVVCQNIWQLSVHPVTAIASKRHFYCRDGRMPVMAAGKQAPFSSNTRAGSGLGPSQWETSLQSNAVSHWLGANLESALNTRPICCPNGRTRPGVSFVNQSLIRVYLCYRCGICDIVSYRSVL